MELSARDELEGLVGDLANELVALKSFLMQQGAIIDRMTYKVEKEGKDRKAKEISSLEEAAHCLVDIKCKNEQDTKEVALYPGYIQICSVAFEESAISECVERINRLKKKIGFTLDYHNKPQQVETTSGKAIKVNPLLFQCMPMVNDRQLRREITLINADVEKVSLGWTVKSRYVKISVEKAIKIATFNKKFPPTIEAQSPQWQSEMDTVLDKLGELPEDTIITRITPNPPVPKLGYRESEVKEWEKVHASLPVLIVTKNDEAVQCDSPLSSYNSKEDFRMYEAFGWSPISRSLGFYLK